MDGVFFLLDGDEKLASLPETRTSDSSLINERFLGELLSVMAEILLVGVLCGD